MTESSVKIPRCELPHETNKKPQKTEQQHRTLSSINKKSEQSEDLKMKNILESQITQENSGMSYASKGHLLIMTIEKIKMRKMYRCFALLKKEWSLFNVLPSQIEVAKKHTKRQQICQISNQVNQSKNQQVKNVLQPVELPINSILQQFKLKTSAKFLSKQLFQSKVKVNSLEKKVDDLLEQLTEAKRRQEKEMLKKRSSLQSLAEQLSDKNEVIQELKVMVRSLEGKLCLKQKNTAFILEEDSDSLRRSLIHLEGVNDKLNFDLSKLKKSQQNNQEKIKEINLQNEKLKNQIHTLKEQIFAFDNVRNQVESCKKQCSLWERRLKNRQLKLAIMQRRNNEVSRCRSGPSANIDGKIFTFATENHFENYSPSQKTQSTKWLQLTNKLEAIFGFLFHIQDLTYHIHSPQLFDEQQKELLKAHKSKVINMMQSSYQNCFTPIKAKERENEVIHDFGMTIINLIENEGGNTELDYRYQESLKQLKHQNERTRLREKISELKEKQLIVRGLLLSFLKSLELRSIKKEASNILDVLFECFEYSEDERQSIFLPKTKKFFGFI